MEHVMTKLIPLVTILILSISGYAGHHEKGETTKQPSVDDLAWMTGTWFGPAGGGNTLEENWTTPKAGALMSMVRMTGENGTSMIEVIVIEEENDSLVLRLQVWDPGFIPRTENPNVFKLVSLGERSVQWESIVDGASLAKLGYSSPTQDKFIINGETQGGQEFQIQLAAP